MSAKQESETLMNALLPVAEEMLRKYGEFYPYGGYMKPDGTIVQVGASDPDTDHPKSKDLIYVLRSSFQDLAQRGKCKAAAMVFDVTVTLPNSEHNSDAIQVSLEHSEGYSTEVFFPYQLIENKLVYGEIFAQQGKAEVFAGGMMRESDAGKQIIANGGAILRTQKQSPRMVMFRSTSRGTGRLPTQSIPRASGRSC